MKFSKDLSPSEAKYKYIGLSKKAREEFPEKDEKFFVTFKGKTYQMSVNNKDSIMLSQLYEAYQFQPDDEIKIKSGENGDFEISVLN